MFVLTKQERRMVLFLAGVILAGTAIGYVRKQSTALRPVLCFEQAYGKININTADKELMKEVPGIGDILARRIIDFRTINGPFEDIEDLRKVKGVNRGRFDRIKEKVCIE